MDSTRDYINSDRHDFTPEGFLNVDGCPEAPATLLNNWLAHAIDQKVNEPYAFNLATVDASGQPHARILYMRDFVEGNPVFYTNYMSDKGQQLDHNSRACMTFFWPELSRQIRIEGRVEKLDEAMSDDYFASRPRGSQIGAWASNQSRELASREELENLIAKLDHEFEGKSIPRPNNWGGYQLLPDYYEFWLGQPSRLHDRIAYSRNKKSWKIKRLNP